MPAHDYYLDSYHGISISKEDWPRLSASAERKIKYFERIYTVRGDAESRDQALCAIADMVYTYETIMTSMLVVDENGNAGTTRVSIGSVSTSMEAPNPSQLGLDMTEAGQIKAYYDILREYMTVYRGMRVCP